MIRQSIQPTYDSRETGPRYHVTTTINDKVIAWFEPTADPFVRHTVHVGWRDLLKGLWHRRLTVTVRVGAHRDTENDVLELDANTLLHNSTRREQFDNDLQQAMADLVPEPDPSNN